MSERKIFICVDNSEMEDRLTVGREYLGQNGRGSIGDYVAIDANDTGAPGSYMAKRFQEKPALPTGLRLPISAFLSERQTNDVRSAPTLTPTQTRFMDFWRTKPHMNVREATAAYLANSEETKPAAPPKVFYRVAHSSVENGDTRGSFLYYGSDFDLAYQALVRAVEAGDYRELFIGRFENTPLDGE